MSYNNLSSVATLEIVKIAIEELHPPLTWGPVMYNLSDNPFRLETPLEGGEALYVVAMSYPGRKGSRARKFVQEVLFTWRAEEVGRLGRKARKENRQFQVITLTSAETPWSRLIELSPVGGREAIEAEDDRGFGFFDRYSWLRGNPRQDWEYISREVCLREVSGWRTAADRALGDYPWGACNNI